MTYRTALKETKDLYLVQFQMDNVIDDSKFVDKNNLKLNEQKLVKYGSSHLEAKIVGIGKSIV